MHRQIAGRLTGPVVKWFVAVFWIVMFGVGGALGSQLTDVQDNQASSWLPETAESTIALNRLEPFFSPNQIPTIVVYEREGGLSADDLAAITDQVAQMSAMDGVVGEAIGPIPSEDGQAAQAIVTFDFGKNGWNDMPDAADDLRGIAAPSTDAGVAVHIGGPGGQAADSAEAFGGIDGVLLYSTLAVVVLILLFTYRSPVLWVLPIISAVTALMVSQGVVYLLAKYAGLTVNGQSQGILTVLVVGAGTDYALLLVARYREELRRHADRHEAMAFALHRATPAILASAATVVLGMLCLLFAEMNSTAGLGPVLAVGVAVTFVVMSTLLPALLVICGRWVFWPRRPTFGSDEPTAGGLWARTGTSIARRPRTVWVGTALALGVACLGLLQLDASGLKSDEQYTQEFDSLTAQRILADHGLANSADPIRVVVDDAHAAQVEQALAGVPGLLPSDAPASKDGTTVLSVSLPGDVDVASQQAFDAVEEIRTAVHAVDGAQVDVGGTSGLYLDIQQASARDNRVVIPVILLVVLVILILLLRALVAPLLLMGTVVLSFGAALGLSTLIFHHVYTRVFELGDGFRDSDASFPLFVFVFLVALGIDYNIFLMSRVREETQVRGTRQGSLVALAATGGVITSAGLVLAATFAVLGTLPLVFLAQLGTAVALGVLLDTMIVRSVLVTALNLDLDNRIWWPSLLDRDPRIEPPAPGAALGAHDTWEPAHH